MYFNFFRQQNTKKANFGDNLYPSLSQFPLLDAAINEAQANIQAPRGLIQNAALTAISVALQGLVDVRKPNGQVAPTSLMLLAIADSGERKSTVENVFLKPIRGFQAKQCEEVRESQSVWKIKYDTWTVRRNGVLKAITKKASKGLPTDEEEKVLLDLEKEVPAKPKEFKLLYEDSTSEALFHGMYENLPTAGLISSEGGGVLEGRAFNDLSKQNAIWSGDSITIDRKTAESFELVGARLTVSLMVQESVFSKYMAHKGGESRGSGLWARFLICRPASTQGTRYISSQAPSWHHQAQFASRLQHFLETGLVCFRENKKEKQVIRFDSEAARLWVEVANDIESRICAGGILDGLGDHGSKLVEVISRLAALLHCFEGFKGNISMSTLQAAIDLAKWYSDEFIKLFGQNSKEKDEEQELNCWLDSFRMTGKRFIKKNYILQYGPGKFRKKSVLEHVLLRLVNHGAIQFFNHPGNKAIYIDLCPWQGGVQMMLGSSQGTNFSSAPGI